MNVLLLVVRCCHECISALHLNRFVSMFYCKALTVIIYSLKMIRSISFLLGQSGRGGLMSMVLVVLKLRSSRIIKRVNQLKQIMSVHLACQVLSCLQIIYFTILLASQNVKVLNLIHASDGNVEVIMHSQYQSVR